MSLKGWMLNTRSRLGMFFYRLPTLWRRIGQLVRQFPTQKASDVFAGTATDVVLMVKYKGGTLLSQTIYRFSNRWGAIVSEHGFASHPTEVVVIKFPNRDAAWLEPTDEITYVYNWKDVQRILDQLRRRPETGPDHSYEIRVPEKDRLFPSRWVSQVNNLHCYQRWPWEPPKPRDQK